MPSSPTCNWSPIWCTLVSPWVPEMCETRVLKAGGDPAGGLGKQLSSGLRYIWGIRFDLPFGVRDHTICWCTDTYTLKARISCKMSVRKILNTRNEVLIRRGLKAYATSHAKILWTRLECVGIFHFQSLYNVRFLTDTCLLVSKGFNIICFVKSWTCHFLTQLIQAKEKRNANKIVLQFQITYCSWKSSIGGSNRMGLQLPRYREMLERKRKSVRSSSFILQITLRCLTSVTESIGREMESGTRR